MRWICLALLAVVCAGEASAQGSAANPFSGRSITFRTGYTVRSCLVSNNQCTTNRVPFGTWQQVYLLPDGQVEVFTYTESTNTYRLGQADDRGNVYRMEGRNLVYRAGGEVWTFRAQGNRCVITVRTERDRDDPFRTTVSLTRHECQLTDGRRPWSHAD